MGISVADIGAAADRLRNAHQTVLSEMTQAEVVEAISRWAEQWQDAHLPWRRSAEALTDPFPFAMVQVSLDALLESLTPDALWALIDREDVRDAHGPIVIGHVIAANTPLLSWVSILRALLMRSASLVKLPSGPAAAWGHLFVHSLVEVSPKLAECVTLLQWAGGTTELDTALCQSVDSVMVHGSDAALASLQALCPPARSFLAYGHRVSFGLVFAGAASDEAICGCAKDILLYDQGGCLSPQTIFVQGDWDDALAFAGRLALALPGATEKYPLTVRAARAAGAVREARLLARMEQGTRLWEDPALRWTVIARPSSCFTASPTFGVISVQPLPLLETLPSALAPAAGRLQGCAIAAPEKDMSTDTKTMLEALGASYICAPGQLQAPPFSWRQDDRDVLRSLLGQQVIMSA